MFFTAEILQHLALKESIEFSQLLRRQLEIGVDFLAGGRSIEDVVNILYNFLLLLFLVILFVVNLFMGLVGDFSKLHLKLKFFLFFCDPFTYDRLNFINYNSTFPQELQNESISFESI